MASFEGVKVYAAGKISKNGWRHELFTIVDNDHDYSGKIAPWPDDVPIESLPGAVYVGPHFLGDDHGCFHGDNTHGVAAGDSACGGAYPGLTRPEVARRCLAAIDEATHVFAWIEDDTAYGTLAELGYARAQGKHIHLYFAEDCPAEEMWFAAQLCTASAVATSATAAWDDFTGRLTPQRLLTPVRS